VGLGKAIELAVRDMDKHSKYVTELRDNLINGLLKIPDTILNGDPKLRLPEM
jgi:cysteine desulfurase